MVAVDFSHSCQTFLPLRADRGSSNFVTGWLESVQFPKLEACEEEIANGSLSETQGTLEKRACVPY